MRLLVCDHVGGLASPSLPTPSPLPADLHPVQLPAYSAVSAPFSGLVLAPQGMGKSYAAASGLARSVSPALVVVPPVLVPVWVGELERAGGNPLVVRTSSDLPVLAGSALGLPGTSVVVTFPWLSRHALDLALPWSRVVVDHPGNLLPRSSVATSLALVGAAAARRVVLAPLLRDGDHLLRLLAWTCPAGCRPPRPVLSRSAAGHPVRVPRPFPPLPLP